MTLYNLAIRRPVFATVVSLMVVLFGGIAFTFLGVREFPAVDPPVITVSTSYRGANADVIESQVTEPLEDSINGISGIRTMTSASREGRSNITVEFDLDADLERAANDVRDKVAQAIDNLPPDVDPPEVQKADADSQAILMLTVSSDRRSLLEVTRFADEVISERLQTIPGVSGVNIWGERVPAMRLWLDPFKLAAYQLAPVDVLTAIQRENVELPAGRIEGQDVQLTVRTMSRLNTPTEFEDLILKETAGRVVRLSDVGRAEIGARNERTAFKADGVPMVAVAVTPLPGSNYIQIADEFHRRLAQMASDVPADIRLELGFDTTRFIRRSIAEVQETVFLSIGLVVAVIFFFLRDWRTTLIPVLAIPVSLIGAFFIMYLAGFTINVLTLLALVLAIGIVVDDAIVVLENIYTKIEAGRPPMEAGIEGTREIFFPVIATTLALIAVFLPILFLGGLTGRLFREFGITLAGAVAISALVALTLTPMLSSRLLKHRDRPNWLYRVTEPFFQGLARGYGVTLDLFLRHRWAALPLLLGCFWVIYSLFQSLPAELTPAEDRETVRLSIRGPEGATFNYMDRVMSELEALTLPAVPERRLAMFITSPTFGGGSANTGIVRFILKDRAERERSQQAIADDLTERVKKITGARVDVFQEPTISLVRRRGLPVEFVVQAPNLERLKDVLPPFLAAAREQPELTSVDVDLQFTNPELVVEIDRARARDLGVSAVDIGRTLQLALAEQRLGLFLIDGKQYEIIGQVERDFRNDGLDLRNLYVPSASGRQVQLDKVITVSERSSPPQLFRTDRYVSATVRAGLAPGKTMGDGIAAMERVAAEVLDDTFATSLAGQARDFRESSESLLFVFVLALVLVYLVLATQFESFRDPLTIMITVPPALAGALVALWWTDNTLNLFSRIGMIMLIGLTTKNGILIVEFANQRKAAGLSVLNAVREAAVARLRPVLMTSLSTTLGILPIALALGAGAESRVPMGVAVVGGLVLGTLLTLYVVPAVYTWLSGREGKAELVEEEPEAEAA